MIFGKLKRNFYDRWEVLDVELNSGDPVDLVVGGHWISGHIEFWNNSYYWFSSPDGAPVVLREGLTVRLRQKEVIGF